MKTFGTLLLSLCCLAVLGASGCEPKKTEDKKAAEKTEEVAEPEKADATEPEKEDVAEPEKTAEAGAEATGAIDANLVRRTVGAALPAFNECASLQAPGKLVLAFQIEADGKVSNASFKEATVEDETVKSCTLKVASELGFPPHGGEPVSVTYPLVFAGAPDGKSIEFEGDEVEARATLSRGTVKEVMKERRGAFRECYDQGLARKADLAGKMVLALEIDEKGLVSKAEASEESLGDAEVVTCLVDAAKETRFDPSKGGATISYPLEFVPAAVQGAENAKAVELSEEEVKRELSRADIQRVVRHNAPAVRKCYQAGLLEKADLQGKVSLSFSVRPDGTIADASIAESTLANETAEGCILQHMKNWEFPTAGGTTKVTYPLVFKPQS